jgi:hypothetical protein
MSEPNAPIPGHDPGPTAEQHRNLIRACRRQALELPNPLLGSLGMINAELMALVTPLAGRTTAELAASSTAEPGPRFFQMAELNLRVIRQIDRLSQLLLKSGPATDGSARASSGTPARTSHSPESEKLGT